MLVGVNSPTNFYRGDILKCLVCSTEFVPKNSLQKYCCKECKAIVNHKIALDKRTIKRKIAFDKLESINKCLICGSDIKVTRQHPHRKYCSDLCSGRAEKVFGNKTELDKLYHNNVKFGGNRTKALLRDNYKCQMCGNQSQLIVHHKDFTGQTNSLISDQIDVNNDINNLVTLCRKCHINLHKIVR